MCTVIWKHCCGESCDNVLDKENVLDIDLDDDFLAVFNLPDCSINEHATEEEHDRESEENIPLHPDIESPGPSRKRQRTDSKDL